MKPLRGAIVGFGQVAEHGHWPAFADSESFDIVAVVDRSAARRETAARLNPRVRTVASLDEIGEGDVDFVDICTPPALHGGPMLAAVGRGWHVICEKPFLLDMATFEAVRDAAASAGRAVVPVHNWKYAPIVRRATALVGEGAIGRLRRVSIETLRLRDCTTSDPDRPNWRRDKAIAGGGILMDHGWHAVYLALHWFGQPPISVVATLNRPAPDEVDDEARATLGFPAGDADVVLSWNADVRRNKMVLVGDEGELEIGDGVLRIRGADSDRQEVFTDRLSGGSYHADWFGAMLPDVEKAFAAPASSWPLLDEAGTCLSVIQRAYEGGGAVSLPRIASSMGLT